MFLVFAVGALVDLTLEPCKYDLYTFRRFSESYICLDNKESEIYYHLGRASLSLRSIFDSPEISTVQAVLVMATFHGNAGKRYTMDSSVSAKDKQTSSFFIEIFSGH